MAKRSDYYDPESAPYYNPKENRRVALVTGGNSGIGWFTALHLYLHGYVVYVAGRTELKVLKAIDDIKEEAGKRQAAYSEAEKSERSTGTLTYIHLDLCDLATVAKCAEDFAAKEPKLDVLINNAGLMGVPYELTKDGYEIQYQVNFVAPFLFTLLLVPTLKNAKSNGAPRVILLSSLAHNSAYKYFEPTDTIHKKPNFIFTWVRYGNAKAAAIGFIRKFAKLHPDILAFSVHPGIIFDTELYNHWKNMPIVGSFAKASFKVSHSLVGVTVEEGSLATLKTALDPSLDSKDSGSYWETGGIRGRPSQIATKDENAEKTWLVNVKLLKEKGFDVEPVKA